MKLGNTEYTLGNLKRTVHNLEKKKKTRFNLQHSILSYPKPQPILSVCKYKTSLSNQQKQQTKNQ